MIDAAKTETMPEKDSFVLAVENVHSPECGKPPNLISVPGDRTYYGYFQNEHGEQFAVSIDQEARQGWLYSGDHGWESPILIADNRLYSDAILSPEEFAWLAACWTAATGEELARPFLC